METFVFEKLAPEHATGVMEIFNYYAENSFAAYPERALPEPFFGKMLEMTSGYPAYAILSDKKVAGFCFVRAYNPFPVFSQSAEISYFIAKDHIGKGLGRKALDKLETDAKEMGIKKILASVTSENLQSLEFHKKNGFSECGRLPGIGEKFGKSFDIVWLIKNL